MLAASLHSPGGSPGPCAIAKRCSTSNIFRCELVFTGPRLTLRIPGKPQRKTKQAKAKHKSKKQTCKIKRTKKHTNEQTTKNDMKKGKQLFFLFLSLFFFRIIFAFLFDSFSALLTARDNLFGMCLFFPFCFTFLRLVCFLVFTVLFVFYVFFGLFICFFLQLVVSPFSLFAFSFAFCFAVCFFMCFLGAFFLVLVHLLFFAFWNCFFAFAFCSCFLFLRLYYFAKPSELC